jgi:outer membrane lipoprotein SlyB
MMAEVNTVPTYDSRVPRNALLIGGGLALAGLGLAAGLMWHAPANTASSPSPAQVAANVPSSTSASPAPVLATAPSSTGEASSPVAQPTAKPAPKEARRHDARTAHTASGGHPTSAPSHELATQPVAATCLACGVIEAVLPVTQKGEGTGLGAVAGGVLGGVAGHSMGGGKGKTAMTVLGAIGGGFAGNEIEKRARSETVYEVRVRMDDGSMRTITQSTAPTPGTRVSLEGQTLRAIGSGNAGGEAEPRLMHASSQRGT